MSSPNANARTMLDWALEYLAAGLPIFPICTPLMGAHQHRRNGKMIDCPPDKRGKTPLVRWRDYQDGLPTEDEVRSWWRRHPNANIGMATGKLSGVIVLDCDSGEARQLCMSMGGLDRTPAVWTGTPGGCHFWLRHPGVDLPNFVRDIPGTDFRGDGGYVLLPPSRHWKGANYRWVENSRGLDRAAPPDWLLQLFEDKARAAPGTSGEWSGEPINVDEILLRGFEQGNRDNGLFKLACRFRHDDEAQARAEAMIRIAARNCTPPFDEDEAVEKVRYVYVKYEAGNVGPTLEDDGWFAPEPRAGDAQAASEAVFANDDEAPPRWQVFNAEDFLALEFPAIEWRVENFMRDKAILFNFGAPGSIKTFVATDGAISVASGGLFLNKYPCARGRVLIVQEDTLASDYQQSYLGPMLRARGLTGRDVRDTLFVAPQAEFALDQAERLRDLCEWMDAHKPDLLIIDAFYLMYSGKREDLLTVMKLLKRIRNKFGCAIWIIDHNRKGQGDATGENPIDRLINGREKSAAVDVVMESRPVKGEHGSTFLDVIKIRGVKPIDPIRVTYADGLITVDGEEEVSPKGAAQTVYEWLCREGGSRTKIQIGRGCDLSERSVHYAVSELHMAGLAKKTGKAGKADLWIAIRRADAEPERQPTIDFDEEGDYV